MAFNKWAKQIPPKKEDTDTSLVMTSTMQDKQRSDLAAIQDKINKALQDIDDIYDEPTSDDPLVRDIENEIQNMENGQFKMKLTSFLKKYQMQEARAHEVDNERTEVLEELADWFDMDHLGNLDMNSGDSSAMAEARFEFSKLQQLNNEMKGMSTDEDGFEEIKKERERLQKMALESFKHAKEVSRRSNMIQEMNQPVEREGGGLWKHAANEIVEMLGKVRTEGKDYIFELERKLRSLLEDGEVLARKVKRLEDSLAEKKKLENKWKTENGTLLKEKTGLQGRIRQVKKELINTRKALSRHESVPPSRFESSKPEDVLESAESGDLLSTARLENLKREHEVLKQEMEELKGTLTSLEKEIEGKDEELVSLEHDKKELIHQMKQASVRPNLQQLSDSSSRLSSLSISMASSHAIKIQKEVPKSVPAPSSQATSVKCSECGKRIDMELEEEGKGPPASKKETAHKKTIKRGAAKARVSKPEKEEKMELEQLRNQVATLENQLATAHQDLINFKLAQAPTQPPYPTPVPAADEMPMSRMMESVTPSRSYTVPVHANEPIVTEKNEVGKTSVAAQPANTSVEVAEEEFVAILPVSETGEEPPDQMNLPSGFVNRGMQTDPKLDPLSEWAQPATVEKGWRPPLPPPGWMEFDPTLDNIEQKFTLNNAMMKGAEPSQIKQEADHAAMFIQKQLSRVVQGIKGFKDYISTMAENDTKKMAAANNKLKSILSQEEASVLDEKFERRHRKSVAGSLLPEPPSIKASRHSRTGFKKLGQVPSTMASDKVYLDELRSLTMNPEEKVKVNIGVVSEKAVSMLEEAMRLLQDSINIEYEQYENIYTTLQKREDGFKFVFDEEEEAGLEPELKRSFSQNDIDDLRQEQSEVSSLNKGMFGRSLDLPTKTIHRSHSDIVIAKGSIHTGMSMDRSVNPTRKEFQVAQATIPKKGLIQISTNQPINSFRAFDIGNLRDVVKKKTKPAPINHQKLLNRQRNLVQTGKVVQKPTFKTASVREPRSFGTDESEDSGNASIAFTLGDLEKNVEVYKESSINTEHMKSVRKAAEYREHLLQGMLPPLPAGAPHSKKATTPATNMKFPPINLQ